MYGDISQGYCALWYNHSCGMQDDLLSQYTTASTYVLIDSSYDCGWGSYSSYYFVLMGTALMLCLLSCCYCRRAVIRRRLAMQRAAAIATRNTARSAAAQPVRAVVYAVRVQDVQ